MLALRFSEWDEDERSRARALMAATTGTPAMWTERAEGAIATMIASYVTARPHPIPHTALVDILFDTYESLRGDVQPDVLARTLANERKSATAADADAMDVDGGLAAALGQVANAREQLENVNACIEMIVHAIAVYDNPVTLADEETKARVSRLVQALKESTWYPTSMLAEHLSLELLDAASVVLLVGAQRHLSLQRTKTIYTLPLYSLALEEPEGFMNLMVVIADTVQAALPATATPDSPLVVEAADGLWDKLDAIMVTHLLSRERVVETLLRAFAVHLTTHWPLFIAVFHRFSLKHLSSVAGATYLFVADPAPGIPEPAATVEDLDQFRTDSLTTQGDTYLSRLDQTLASYRDDIPFFINAASASAVPSTRTRNAPEVARDRNLAETFIDRATRNSTPLLRNLAIALALLVKHDAIVLEDVLAHFVDENPDGVSFASVVAPPVLETRPVQDAPTDELLKPAMQKAKPSAPPVVVDGEVEAAAKARADRVAAATPAVKRNVSLLAMLFTAQLAVGDYANALRGMARYPEVDWIHGFPPIAKQLLRLVGFVLGDTPLAPEQQLGECDDEEATERQLRHLVPVIYTKAYPGRQRFFYGAWARDLPRGDVKFALELLERAPQLLYLRPAAALRLADACDGATGGLRLPAGVPVVAVLKKYLLPALMLSQPPPPALGARVWALVKAWPATQRYLLYRSITTELYTTGPLLPLVHAHVEATTRFWMKRISKDVVRTYSRKLCKLAHANPVPVLARIVATVMAYDNLSGPLLECLRYLDPLAMDVLMYTFLGMLANPAAGNVAVADGSRGAVMLCRMPIGFALKDDGQNLDGWLGNTARFLAAWLAQYPGTDFAPLLAFLDHQAATPTGGALGTASAFGLADAQLLSDLVDHMAGIQPVQDLSGAQVRALESHDCVAKRVMTAGIVASSVFEHHAQKGTDPFEVRRKSTAALVRYLAADRGALAARFLAHLRILHATLAERTRDWADFSVPEKVHTNDLLVELQWKDRVKSILAQFATFLRLYVVPEVAQRDGEEAAREIGTAARFALAPPQRKGVFWDLRHYHVVFDASAYLPEEQAARDVHLADYTAAAAKITAVIDEAKGEMAAVAAAAAAQVEAEAAARAQADAAAKLETPAADPVVATEAESAAADSKVAVESESASVADADAMEVDSIGTPTTDVDADALDVADQPKEAAEKLAVAADPVETKQAETETTLPAPAAAEPAAPAIPVLATRPRSTVLPSAADLLQRAAESPADAEYACYWAAKVGSAILYDVATRVWALRGMTEAEAANASVLIARALELLYAESDAAESATEEKQQVAQLALAAHNAVATFVTAVLGSTYEADDDEDDMDDFFAPKLDDSETKKKDEAPKPPRPSWSTGRPADVYLVRNSLTMLKSLTAARVFPALHADGDAVLAHLARHRDNEGLRVMVLVLVGAINTVKAQGYPLAAKLVKGYRPPTPPPAPAPAPTEKRAPASAALPASARRDAGRGRVTSATSAAPATSSLRLPERPGGMRGGSSASSGTASLPAAPLHSASTNPGPSSLSLTTAATAAAKGDDLPALSAADKAAALEEGETLPPSPESGAPTATKAPSLVAGVASAMTAAAAAAAADTASGTGSTSGRRGRRDRERGERSRSSRRRGGSSREDQDTSAGTPTSSSAAAPSGGDESLSSKLSSRLSARLGGGESPVSAPTSSGRRGRGRDDDAAQQQPALKRVKRDSSPLRTGGDRSPRGSESGGGGGGFSARMTASEPDAAPAASGSSSAGSGRRRRRH
ncbi:THO2 plays a role in transcriptional elongation [Blastocladiella emersonii ATCC 22665]|nr:THO2 plays a role in transcriptional elongation [Blastocladiella emersonii ATCC 22665]